MGQHYYILQLFRIFGRDIASQLLRLVASSLPTTPYVTTRLYSAKIKQNKTKKSSRPFRPMFSSRHWETKKPEKKGYKQRIPALLASTPVSAIRLFVCPCSTPNASSSFVSDPHHKGSLQISGPVHEANSLGDADFNLQQWRKGKAVRLWKEKLTQYSSGICSRPSRVATPVTDNPYLQPMALS